MEGPYKFLVEVLVNRLKKVVRKVASAFQHVFVEGHQILDAVIMWNEAIDSRLKNFTNGVVCKWNIHKGIWSCQLEFFVGSFGKNGIWSQVDLID